MAIDHKNYNHDLMAGASETIPDDLTIADTLTVGGTTAISGATTVTTTATGTVGLTNTTGTTTVDGALFTGSGAHASGKGEVRITNSGATAAGGSVLTVSATGTPAAATGYLAHFTNAGITATNNPIAVQVTQTGTGAAIGVTAAAISTNYFKIGTFNGVTFWVGNGNTANSVLSGTAGDFLLNGGSNKPEYCTGTTNWTALV